MKFTGAEICEGAYMSSGHYPDSKAMRWSIWCYGDEVFIGKNNAHLLLLFPGDDVTMGAAIVVVLIMFEAITFHLDIRWDHGEAYDLAVSVGNTSAGYRAIVFED